MNVSPLRHSIEYGETLRWLPPPGTSRFILWTKTDPHTWLDDGDPGDRTYGGGSPRWAQLSGYDIEADAALDLPEAGPELTAIELTAAGIVVGWQSALAIFDGHDPEVLMVTAADGAGKVIAIDRFRLPAPNSTDAGTIAAQERRLLQTLLNSRERVAAAGGKAKVDSGEGTGHELMDLAALDRRVAEVRARIVWFDTAAGGNALPRAEHW